MQQSSAPANVSWNSFKDARPYVTVSGLAVDGQGVFPILYRGPNVRSAKNCWSLPSGLHEVGYTLERQFITELEEECNLTVDNSRSVIHVGVYENISVVDRWHWVIHLMVARVSGLDSFVNQEPDKHPTYEITSLDDLYGRRLVLAANGESGWAPGLREALLKYEAALREAVKQLTASN